MGNEWQEFNSELAAQAQQAQVAEGIRTLWRIVQSWDEARRSDPANQAEIDNSERFDIYEYVVSIAAVQAAEEDDCIWNIAELAALAAKRYGADFIGELAHDVNLSKRVLWRRRQVFTYFGRDLIDRYRADAILRYSHFFEAMRVGTHYESIHEAIRFLDDCIAYGWRVGQAEVEARKRIGKPMRPQKFLDANIRVLSVTNNIVHVEFENPAAVEVLRKAQRDHSRCLVKVYEVDAPQRVTTSTPLPQPPATGFMPHYSDEQDDDDEQDDQEGVAAAED